MKGQFGFVAEGGEEVPGFPLAECRRDEPVGVLFGGHRVQAEAELWGCAAQAWRFTLAAQACHSRQSPFFPP